MDNKNKTPNVQTVVQGEASESDEEEEKEVQNSSATRVPPFPSRVLQSKLSSPAKRKVGGTQAVVVAGEASESEEEEVDTSVSESGSPELTPLKVEPSKKLERGSSSDLSDVPMLMSPRMAESRYNKPKYDTLLHRKLRENNWQLHEHMVEVAGQAYLGAARSLSSTTTHLVKSHSVVQDISHSMRLLTNDLFHLEDRIDIIQSCKLLPDINIPAPAPAEQAKPAQAAAT
ncbi:biogenesis of lysosome-related organelles complex 1 subunit 3-like isoform X1 [Littorina saxatilis]|uniref:Biogenesis of lysosome-related organelles complex 1 subunit 3 n=1 Tax=Littorina saxatilis TaxID=31220 RepID=A0AAN9GGV6_9CAEN